MSRTPVGERLSPDYHSPRLPTRRTRVLLALLGRSWPPMPVFRLCSRGRRGERGNHPQCVRLRPHTSSATAATRVVGSPGPLSCSEGRVGRVSHAPGSPMLPVQALCHPPLTSAHRGANGIGVRALAEVPRSAPARCDRRRCRGGGGRQPCGRKHSGEEGCSSVVKRASPGQVPVARRRHRGVVCRGRGAERRQARARHRTASRAFRALSCLRDRGVLDGGRRALSPITDHRNVKTRTWWIVREPMVGCCLPKPTVRQRPHRSSTRAVCDTPEPLDGETPLPRVMGICSVPCVALAGPGKRRHAPGVCGRHS